MNKIEDYYNIDWEKYFTSEQLKEIKESHAYKSQLIQDQLLKQDIAAAALLFPNEQQDGPGRKLVMAARIGKISELDKETLKNMLVPGNFVGVERARELTYKKLLGIINSEETEELEGLKNYINPTK